MSTENPKHPLLNPVLVLKKEVKKEGVTGGGKDASKIVQERIGAQTALLSSNCDHIYEHRKSFVSHGGKVHLVASMFDDSYAPTYRPDSIFNENTGCRFVAPVRNGYLIEATTNQLPVLSDTIRNPSNIASQVDISRIKTVNRFDQESILRNFSIDELWNKAPEVEDGKLFLVWFAPFHDEEAKNSLMETLQELEKDRVLIPTTPAIKIPSSDEENEGATTIESHQQSSLARAMRKYRSSGHARASVKFSTKENLLKLIGSGASYRIEPVKSIEITAAGEGKEPEPPTPDISSEPIVGVIDGGLTANSYKSAEAWKAPAFVPDGIADHAHGNQVTSLVVQAHAWNTNLSLPSIYCRVGTVQAVPKKNSNYPINTEQLVDYIDSIMKIHPETKVWNFSVNEPEPVDSQTVSYLGHEITRLARQYEILPVISVGNKSNDNDERLCPPADCEAALVVGGRAYSNKGKPHDACPVCLPGPGPEGMLKPDLSWYSSLRVIGGLEKKGSSYATPLVSSLAAHTYENLKDPTADIVRALLINAAEFEEFCAHRGWGTPYHNHMPWVCTPGMVTLVWRSKLRPKTAYYWEGIPIPPQLVRNGKLYGKASLTAVLNPLTSEEGEANYFATRLAVALQYEDKNAKNKSLLGSMKEDTLSDVTDRTDLAQWHPIRRHMRDFTKRDGLGFSGNTMRLYARVYARDLYQFNFEDEADIGDQEVAFVLSFCDSSDNVDMYNSVAQQLGNFVESAVVNQEIEITS